MQESEHGRKREEEGWKLSVTAGSQDAIYKVCFYFMRFCVLESKTLWRVGVNEK